MAKILVTGSSDGLGLLAAKELINLGHQVVLHARNDEKAQKLRSEVPGALDVMTADLSNMNETRQLAQKANSLGSFDVVIHNAGLYRVPARSLGAEGLPLLLTVNTLAPYLLTALMFRPKRLVYMSSGMHRGGNPDLDFSTVSYSDTKLHDLILAKAVARLWPEVLSNAVDPGWVPTKMGGASAPDSLEKGFGTQVWLAVSDEPDALLSGRYLHHKRKDGYLDLADDINVQDRLLKSCEEATGVVLR